MLPSDICRCHDDDCRDRESCRRWTERYPATSEPSRQAVNAASLFQEGPAGRCENRIPAATDAA